MNSKPTFQHAIEHRGSQLPVIELWEGLQISMEQDGAKRLTVFLSPQKALILAENLIRMARERLEKNERHERERARK
jgi:hypothetical protein